MANKKNEPDATEASSKLDYAAKLKELDEAFYGTLVDRDEETGGKMVPGPDGTPRPEVRRQRHEHDGWREGHSKPFELGGKTYDADPDSMAVTQLTWQRLRDGFLAKIALVEPDVEAPIDSKTGKPDPTFDLETARQAQATRRQEAKEKLDSLAKRGVVIP